MRMRSVGGRWLAVAFLLAGVGGVCQGQSFPRTLDEIKTFGKGETVQFVFSQPFEGTPGEEHRPGSMAFNFMGTGSAKPLRELRPKDESIYKTIQVVQNKYSTTVTFVFNDPTLSLKDHLHFAPNGNVLTAEVRRPGEPAVPAPAPLEPENKLLVEMEQRISGAGTGKTAAGKAAPVAAAAPSHDKPAAADVPAPPPAKADGALGGLSEGSFFSTLATMVTGLAVMLLLLYGVLLLYKRYVAPRLGQFAGMPAFKQVASFSIGPRQRIVVLEINGEMIACGVTPTQITFLTRLSGGDLQARGQGEATEQSEVRAAARALSGVAAGAGRTPGDPSKPDPVHQFAELLKQKVRSLKRIN
jgi:flagellar protein FliO/FliZ